MKETPGWDQIVDQLVRDVREHQFKKDDRLPSENDMAIRFGVPRSDIRKAYDRLKELGFVYSVQGSGSFFAGEREMIPLQMRGGGFSKKMRELNLPYESKNIEARKINYNSMIYDSLGAKRGEKIWKIVRLRTINHEPAAIHTSYLPEKQFPTLPQDAARITSIYQYFEETGHTGHRGRDAQLRVTTMQKKEREILNVQGYAPALTLSGLRLAADGETLLEVFSTVYRSDRFIFLL